MVNRLGTYVDFKGLEFGHCDQRGNVGEAGNPVIRHIQGLQMRHPLQAWQPEETNNKNKTQPKITTQNRLKYDD